MQSLKQLMLVASFVAIPTLSFAQSIAQPANGITTAPAASLPDAPGSQTGAQSQLASHDGYRLGESSGYGAQATGSSQSSQRPAAPFLGKDSQLFRH